MTKQEEQKCHHMMTMPLLTRGVWEKDFYHCILLVPELLRTVRVEIMYIYCLYPLAFIYKLVAHLLKVFSISHCGNFKCVSNGGNLINVWLNKTIVSQNLETDIETSDTFE